MAEATSVQEQPKDKEITEQHCCGYCLQHFFYLDDIRELPCSHVFCLPCLEASYTSDTLQCGICQ